MKFKYLILAVLCSQYQWAQEYVQETEELQELIIEGNRLQLPFYQASRVIQVITKEDIAKLPVQSLNELLTYIGGVDMRQRGPFGMQADISIDGGTFEQTMVLWNGVKMGDAQTAHHSLNLPIPLAAIERIEILKGPAARKYGINALTGAINIVTKTKSNDFIQLDTSMGSSFRKKEDGDGTGVYSGYQIQATSGVSTHISQHLGGISYSDFNGQRYNTAAANFKAFYQGNLNLHSDHQLHAFAGYTQSQFGANGFYAAPHDRESYELVQTLLTSISSTHSLTDRIVLKPRISNRYNEDDYRFYRNDLHTARSLHYSNALMMELNGVYHADFGDFGIGYELRWEEIHSSNIGFHNRNNHGWYAEYKNNFGQKWLLNVGAYWNYNSDYGFQWYPGADVSYQLHDYWKAAFSIGSSQRIPSFTDLYLNQQPGNIGNPDLKPEAAWQYEFGLHYYKQKRKFLLNYFNRSITDFIDWTRETTDVPYQPHNMGEQRMQGIFAQWKQEFERNNNLWGYQVSYQYLSPKEVNSSQMLSKYVIESLKHQLIVGFNYSYKKFGLQWQNRWIKRERNEGYFVSDIKAMTQWNSFEIYTQASNLFNASYKEAGAVPMPSRWVQLGIKYNLSLKKASL